MRFYVDGPSDPIWTHAASAWGSDKNRVGWVPADGSAVISGSTRNQKSQHSQTIIKEGAYHREIGREATAAKVLHGVLLPAYHREIGREATAVYLSPTYVTAAYHREIGREATAGPICHDLMTKAYHREIGREATAINGGCYIRQAEIRGLSQPFAGVLGGAVVP